MEDGKYAAMMQTLFYTLVYLKNQPTAQVLPVIYHLKSAENMVKPARETGYYLRDLQYFEALLKSKLQEIWDSTTPFAFDDSDEESKYLMMEVL